MNPDLDLVLRAAIGAADPVPLVARGLAGTAVPLALEQGRRVRVIAAGKCASGMIRGLGDATRYAGILRVGIEDAAHPEPDGRSLDAARRALATAALAGADEVLLVLLSGGASSLLALPAAGITLPDKRETIRRLLLAGAPIADLNAVRKHISAIKGGQLAAATRAEVVTLIVSDVVGDDVSVIASGPTVPDPTTFATALNVLEHYGGAATYPAAVVARLGRGAAGQIEETPKPGGLALTRTTTQVVGSVRDAIDGAARAAAGRGYAVHVIGPHTIGESRAAAARVVDAAAALPRNDTGLCVIAGGETTVTVRGGGRGGRNQELALAMVPLVGRLGASVAAASFGTDGIDGPTDAAGACVDTTTLERAQRAGLAPARYLDDNNSYEFFNALGDLIRTGPTGTNVGDLQIILIGGASQARSLP